MVTPVAVEGVGEVMDLYTIKVTTHDMRELNYEYRTNRGAFAAIEAIMFQFVKDFPLSDAAEVDCKIHTTRDGKLVI